MFSLIFFRHKKGIINVWPFLFHTFYIRGNVTFYLYLVNKISVNKNVLVLRQIYNLYYCLKFYTLYTLYITTIKFRVSNFFSSYFVKKSVFIKAAFI